MFLFAAGFPIFFFIRRNNRNHEVCFFVSEGFPRLVLFIALLAIAGIILAGAAIQASDKPASPAACFNSMDDCVRTCTEQAWKTGQGGSCATACAGWEDAKCPSAAVPDAALAEYTRCTSGCVRTNVVYISPTGPQNPGDDACMQKCRDEYLKQ